MEALNQGLQINTGGKLDSHTGVSWAATPIVYLSVVASTLGLHFLRWNIGFGSGYWELVGAQLILWSAYLCKALCLAEITGSLPFTGGNYALARVTIGPMLGYLTGCLEILQSAIVSSLCVWQIASIFTADLLENRSRDTLLVCIPVLIVVYGLAYAQDTGLSSAVVVLLSSVCVVLWTVYVFGSAGHMNFSRYYDKNHSASGISFVGDELILGAWFFLLLPSIPVSARSISQPKYELPILLTAMGVVSLATALVTTFIVAGQFPGTHQLVNSQLPFSYSFSRIFAISMRAALWLSLPAVLCTAVNTFHTASQQLASMSYSGLLPSVLKFAVGPFFSAPSSAGIFGLLLMFLFNIAMKRRGGAARYTFTILAIFCSFGQCISILVSFLVFRKKFECLENTFRNPLRSYGAYYGLAVFSGAWIYAIVQQSSDERYFILFSGTCILCVIYYYAYGRRSQCFSEEEQRVMFVAYVINANIKSKLKRKASMSLIRESSLKSFSLRSQSYRGNGSMNGGSPVARHRTRDSVDHHHGPGLMLPPSRIGSNNSLLSSSTPHSISRTYRTPFHHMGKSATGGQAFARQMTEELNVNEHSPTKASQPGIETVNNKPQDSQAQLSAAKEECALRQGAFKDDHLKLPPLTASTTAAVSPSGHPEQQLLDQLFESAKEPQTVLARQNSSNKLQMTTAVSSSRSDIKYHPGAGGIGEREALTQHEEADEGSTSRSTSISGQRSQRPTLCIDPLAAAEEVVEDLSEVLDSYPSQQPVANRPVITKISPSAAAAIAATASALQRHQPQKQSATPTNSLANDSRHSSLASSVGGSFLRGLFSGSTSPSPGGQLTNGSERVFFATSSSALGDPDSSSSRQQQPPSPHRNGSSRKHGFQSKAPFFAWVGGLGGSVGGPSASKKKIYTIADAEDQMLSEDLENMDLEGNHGTNVVTDVESGLNILHKPTPAADSATHALQVALEAARAIVNHPGHDSNALNQPQMQTHSHAQSRRGSQSKPTLTVPAPTHVYRPSLGEVIQHTHSHTHTSTNASSSNINHSNSSNSNIFGVATNQMSLATPQSLLQLSSKLLSSSKSNSGKGDISHGQQPGQKLKSSLDAQVSIDQEMNNSNDNNNTSNINTTINGTTSDHVTGSNRSPNNLGDALIDDVNDVQSQSNSASSANKNTGLSEKHRLSVKHTSTNARRPRKKNSSLVAEDAADQNHSTACNGADSKAGDVDDTLHGPQDTVSTAAGSRRNSTNATFAGSAPGRGGFLRKSITQLTTNLTKLLPPSLVEDQKDFEEYTKCFVEAMLDDVSISSTVYRQLDAVAGHLNEDESDEVEELQENEAVARHHPPHRHHHTHHKADTQHTNAIIPNDDHAIDQSQLHSQAQSQPHNGQPHNSHAHTDKKHYHHHQQRQHKHRMQPTLVYEEADESALQSSYHQPTGAPDDAAALHV